MTQTIIFTDGASRGNPGPGGWGSIIVSHVGGDASTAVVQECGGREDGTTNNRMEITAALKSLEFIIDRENHQDEILIYTDSSYLRNGAMMWLSGWKARNWKTKQQEDVANRDLWQRLDNVLSNVSVTWKLLPGHSDVVGNERADAIATAFADKKNIELFSGNISDYSFDILNVSVSQSARAKKSRSKEKAFSYVSLVDGVVMTHATWKECEDRVKGKKARFKKALDEDDEKKIIREFGGHE